VLQEQSVQELIPWIGTQSGTGRLILLWGLEMCPAIDLEPSIQKL